MADKKRFFSEFQQSIKSQINDDENESESSDESEQNQSSGSNNIEPLLKQRLQHDNISSEQISNSKIPVKEEDEESNDQDLQNNDEDEDDDDLIKILKNNLSQNRQTNQNNLIGPQVSQILQERGGYLQSSQQIEDLTSNDIFSLQCQFGHVWDSNFNNIIQVWCPQCEYQLKQIRNYLDKSNIQLVSKFYTQSFLQFRCKIKQHIWSEDIQRGFNQGFLQCPECREYFREKIFSSQFNREEFENEGDEDDIGEEEKKEKSDILQTYEKQIIQEFFQIDYKTKMQSKDLAESYILNNIKFDKLYEELSQQQQAQKKKNYLKFYQSLYYILHIPESLFFQFIQLGKPQDLNQLFNELSYVFQEKEATHPEGFGSLCIFQKFYKKYLQLHNKKNSENQLVVKEEIKIEDSNIPHD